MKTLISIDWDFFVPEDPAWDMGHQENLLFLKMLWSTRGHLIDKMLTTGEEKKFWPKIENLAPSLKHAKLYVSDSHCYAFNQAVSVDHILLIDAHHDCWGNSPGYLDCKSVMCHNWARIWLESNPRHKLTWVRPSWQKASNYPLPKDLKGRIDVVNGLNGLKQPIEGTTSLHVCRSGCWTPPWLDKQFAGFLEGFTGHNRGVIRLQDRDWDAMVCRWTDKDLADAIEQDKQIQIQMNAMRVGQISSNEFINAKMEIAI